MELNYFEIIPIELRSIILVYLDRISRFNIERTYKVFQGIIDSELFRINITIFKYKDYYKYIEYLKFIGSQDKFFDIEYKTSRFIFHFKRESLQNNYRYSIELNVNVDRNINLKNLIYNNMKDFEKIFKDSEDNNDPLQITFTEYGRIIRFKSDPYHGGAAISEHEFFILILKLYLIGIGVDSFNKF